MNHRHAASLHRLAWGFAALALSPASWGQYKVVEPNGRVTYTDRPTPSPAAKIEPIRATGGTTPATANLPFALRQVIERYPVTLFTADACQPCDAGRNLLRQRGIPFTEKTVNTPADLAALQATEASGELPVLRIGTQQLRGFAQTEWSSYLDAAAYPKQSQLPPSYKAADPAPLVAAKPAGAKAPVAPPPPPQGPAALPPALETAPNGIRF